MLTPTDGAHPLTRGRQSNKRNKPAPATPPPADMPADEAQVWRDTCRRQNAEWLDTGPGPLLEDYCAAVVRLRKLRTRLRLEEADPDNKGRTSMDLLEAADKVSQGMQRLARALRLTPQARIRADKADNNPGQPWRESEDGSE